MKNSILSVIKHIYNPNKKTNMETEIYEQTDVVKKLVETYISENNITNIDVPTDIKRVVLIASGSSYHSAAIAANYIRNKAHCFAQAYYASEFSLFENVEIGEETLYIFISQSGETKDTNTSLDIVKAKSNKTLSITNTKDSSLYKNTDYKIYINAGIENSIASTKALTAQIFCLYLVAGKIMQQKGVDIMPLVKELKAIPEVIEKSLSFHEKIKEFSKKLSTYNSACVTGCGMLYALAKEGALKIKETSYLNTTAYPTGEFLHGHIAILNKKCAAIAIVGNDNKDLSIKVLDKMNDEYNTDILVLTSSKLHKINSNNHHICIETPNDIVFLFGALIILQLIALENATNLGRNVDTPTGLSKVVSI